MSKFATHPVGTPSRSGVSRSSETIPRSVRVRAATTTEPMWSATGSRVRTRTGLSPLGVTANQISPRCMCPVRPILCRSPVRDRLERCLVLGEWFDAPGLDITFCAQADQMTAQGVAEELRTIDPELVCPSLRRSCLVIIHPKTEHCHTESVVCMTVEFNPEEVHSSRFRRGKRRQWRLRTVN